MGTSALDAEPDLILEMPGDSFAPLTLTIGLSALFAGAVLRQWWLVGLGVLIAVAALVDWFWPRRIHASLEAAHD